MTCKDKCVCGTDPHKPWETYKYCEMKKLVGQPIKKPTAKEIIIMEHNMEIMHRIKDYPMELQDLFKRVVYQASKHTA